LTQAILHQAEALVHPPHDPSVLHWIATNRSVGMEEWIHTYVCRTVQSLEERERQMIARANTDLADDAPRSESNQAMLRDRLQQQILGQVDARGRTPLHIAAAQGREEIVRAFLSLNAPTEARDECGVTPLWLACMGHHLGCVRRTHTYAPLVLSAQRQPGDPGCPGYHSPLDSVCEQPHGVRAGVAATQSKDAGHVRTRDGGRPRVPPRGTYLDRWPSLVITATRNVYISCCTTEHHKEICEILLSQGANVDRTVAIPPFQGMNLLGFATLCNDPDLIECFLKHGVSVQRGAYHPVNLAVKENHVSMIQWILARPDKMGIYASEEGNYDDLCQKRKKDKEYNNEEQTYICIREEEEEEEEEEVNKDDLYEHGARALLQACHTRNAEMVQILLKQGGLSPNLRVSSGRNALFKASFRGDIRNLTCLLAAGAHVEGQGGGRIASCRGHPRRSQGGYTTTVTTRGLRERGIWGGRLVKPYRKDTWKS